MSDGFSTVAARGEKVFDPPQRSRKILFLVLGFAVIPLLAYTAKVLLTRSHDYSDFFEGHDSKRESKQLYNKYDRNADGFIDFRFETFTKTSRKKNT